MLRSLLALLRCLGGVGRGALLANAFPVDERRLGTENEKEHHHEVKEQCEITRRCSQIQVRIGN